MPDGKKALNYSRGFLSEMAKKIEFQLDKKSAFTPTVMRFNYMKDQ
ncbi:MAG: hypothetical protein KGZ90_12010 [Algoriphagus sp.]|nr:hypothetical protein [Algoriphagus sp.]